MTKCIVLGTIPKEEEKKLVPIVFSKVLTYDLDFVERDTLKHPSEYKVLELICENYTQDLDIIFAHDNVRSMGILYLGHWNDGVVE